MNIRVVENKCEQALQQLEELFAPRVQLTLLIRNPELEDADMIVSHDDLDEVIGAITKLKELKPVRR